MDSYKGKVVVITGAGNGLGKGLAGYFAEKGAKLALTDWDAENLAIVEEDLKAKGAEVIASRFDVGSLEDMESFACQTYETFGTVDILFNNAGVGDTGCIWDGVYDYWKWLYNVNVMGVVHGIRAFVPSMIKENKECWVITTASFAGLVNMTGSPAYNSAKQAAVNITETLNLQLQMIDSKVKAFVICPGPIATNIYNSSRNSERKPVPESIVAYTQTEEYEEKYQKNVAYIQGQGLPIETAIDTIIKGLEADNFYIYTHPEVKYLFELRTKHIFDCTRPTVQTLYPGGAPM